MGARALALLVLVAGCRRPARPDAGLDSAPIVPPTHHESVDRTPAHPAGATCGGRDDCAAGQVCVGGRCRYRRTSLEGEILLAAGQAQWEAGDAEGARETFARALEAFARQGAPPPPELLCGAALAGLAFRDTPSDRERGAEDAARCLRGSLPADPHRQAVLEALAAQRYDGLRLAAFDEPRPERFYGEGSSRPPIDAVTVEVLLPETDAPGLAAVRRTLSTDAVRRSVGECFLRDWERHHRRTAEAPLLLDLTTQPRDLGGLRIYVSRVRVIPTRAQEDGFDACVSRELANQLREGPRLSQATVWQIPFEVRAKLR